MSLTGAYRGGFQTHPGWYISFTYDAEQVEKLKQAIPHTERSWDPEKKQWWVSAAYEDVLLRLWPAFAAYQAQKELF